MVDVSYVDTLIGHYKCQGGLGDGMYSPTVDMLYMLVIFLQSTKS